VKQRSETKKKNPLNTTFSTFNSLSYSGCKGFHSIYFNVNPFLEDETVNTLSLKWIKAKAAPLQARKALGGGGAGDIAPTHSLPRYYMGVSGQRHAPAAP
jgi:hypothetical protein